MNEIDALELVRAAIWTVIVASGPPVAGAMAAGVAIALFQALTQVQEVTLTFVPKIVAIFLIVIAMAPFLASQLHAFSEVVFGRIATGF
jgi:flagellar biosynthetic protein FliQ